MLNVKILGALLARKVENYKDPSNRELTVLTGAYAGALPYGYSTQVSPDKVDPRPKSTSLCQLFGGPF